MKQLNYNFGKAGERTAADYLAKEGFKIIDRNFQIRFGEIDLVAGKGDRLHFVEVKLRVGEDFGTPEEMINRRKFQKVQALAELFLQRNPKVTKIYPLSQIDAICIVLNEDGSIRRINHYENINI